MFSVASKAGVLSAVVVSAIMSASCGSSQFKGSSAGGGTAVEAGGDASETSDFRWRRDRTNPIGTDTIGGFTDEDRIALDTCLKKWGVATGQSPDMNNVKRIRAAVSVLGRGTVIEDTVVTSAPQLILIDAAVNVLGSTQYNLLNPNGWYCLKVGVNVRAAVTVNLHQNARLADTSTSVGVRSEGQTAGQVSVNVGSTVRVNRVGN